MRKTTYRFRASPGAHIGVFDHDGGQIFEGQDFRNTREALSALKSRFEGRGVRINVVYDNRGEPEMATIEDSDRELEFQIPPETEAELDRLGDKIRGTKAEVISWALALLKVAVEANDRGNKLIIVDRKGKPVSEVTLFSESDE